MNKQPRLFPVFVAASLFLVSGPLPAAAQLRAAAGVPSAVSMTPPAAIAGAQATGGFSAPLTNLGLHTPLYAPSAAPTPLINAPLSVSAAAHHAGAPAIVRVPGGPLARVAEEAAAYSNQAPVVATAKESTEAPAARSLAGRVLDFLLRRPAPSISFDGASEKSSPIFGRMDIREHAPLSLPNGTRPDEQPVTPSPDFEPTTRVEAYGLPGGRDVGGIFETSRKVLSVDPANMNAIVDAIKALIDGDRARYGVSSADLRLIHTRAFEGNGEQADTVFVLFRQIKSNIAVNGSALSFTIKILDGKPTIVAQTGQVFPQLDVVTETILTDDHILERIVERTGLSTQQVSEYFKFYEQKIIYSRGAWHHVKLYVADGLPYMVAVDMNTGLVFAWDNRAGLESASAVSGKTSGRAVDKGPILRDSKISEIPLPFLEITLGGKSYVTDKDGRFSADSGLVVGPEGLTLTSTLSGPFVRLENQQGDTLSVQVTVKPGDNQIIFNPKTGIKDENTLAQIGAFNKVNLSLAFLRERKLAPEDMIKTQLPVRTNIDDECNAYYTPGRPTLNFFRSSANCVNSAYDTVAEHENGHFWDDFSGGIVNGGLSEGWGDILSMFRLNNPIIGEHFMKQSRGGVDYIRHGDNKYQYNDYDEVHAQGQAWGGFAWKLRKALIAKLGYDEGASVAEALVLPTMFAKASTIPDAIAQVLVNATDKNGAILHEKEIRSAAKAHGIDLPQPTAGVLSYFTGLRAPAAVIMAGLAEPETDGAAPTFQAKLTFSAGLLIRKKVVNELRRYLDAAGLKYDLKVYDGWFSSDYLLIIEGPEDQVREHTGVIARWFDNHQSK